MIFLSSLPLSNTPTFLTRSVQLIFSILLQHHISQISTCISSIQVSAPYDARHQTYNFSSFFLKFKSHLLGKTAFLFLKATSATAILDLISHVHLLSSVIMLPQQLKYSTFQTYSYLSQPVERILGLRSPVH